MRVSLLKSKIHRATVTAADLDYEGSISIDPGLLEAARIVEFERVEVYNVTNGERFATYAIRAAEPGVVCINGAAAWKARAGDIVIIACYCEIGAQDAMGFKPTLVYVDKLNQVSRISR